MAAIPPGLGPELELYAVRPVDIYVDRKLDQVRVGTALADERVLYLWMKRSDFQQSLEMLALAAKQYGIPWPKEPTV